MHELKDIEDLHDALRKEFVILFKHSGHCGISATALDEMDKFVAVHKDAPVYCVNVQHARDVSDAIEKHAGIRHESPQVIIFQHGVPVWDASHFDITAARIEEASVSFR